MTRYFFAMFLSSPRSRCGYHIEKTEWQSHRETMEGEAPPSRTA
jgi:hypothetical protein